MRGAGGLESQVSGRESETGPRPEESRKRYYIFSPDLTVAHSDHAFVNQGEALIDGRSAGRHEHSVPGYMVPICTGVPPLRERPKLVLGAECEGLLDIYGFGPRFVSGRAKAVLSEIDPEGFEFVECDTVDAEGNSLEPYWMTDAIRLVNGFDEGRSSFRRYVDQYPENADPLNLAIVALNDIRMSPELPESHHAFYFPSYQGYFIVDDILADAWREARLSGATLTPLQTPTQEEFGAEKQYPDHLSFLNYPYWTQRGIGS
jgi:hypothetical protein